MLRRLLPFILFIGQTSFAQSAKPVQVPGTNYSIAPPPGFTPARNFSGFMDEQTGASVMINELRLSYKELVENITAEVLEKKEMTLISKTAIDFSGSPATVLHASQQVMGVPYLKEIMVFGDTGHVVMVNGLYPKNNKELAAPIHDALLSTTRSGAGESNPLDAVPFTLDLSGTDFRPTIQMLGSIGYTTDDQKPTKGPLIIASVSQAKADLQHRRQYFDAWLEKVQSGTPTTTRKIQEITIDDMAGYEAVLDRKNPAGAAQVLYQVMLFHADGDFYIFFAQGENTKANLATFKRIARTFQRR